MKLKLYFATFDPTILAVRPVFKRLKVKLTEIQLNAVLYKLQIGFMNKK